MASKDLELRNIKFKDQLRSKPTRLNFSDIENEFNLLRSEVYASLASTASEVTSARDNFSNLTDNINERRVYGNDFASTDYASETSTPAMKVRVAAGSGVINGVGVNWDSATSATLTAPTAGNHRIDIVTINNDNTLTIDPGTATATSNHPSINALGDTQDQLAYVYLTAGTTTLNDDIQVFNVKPKDDFYEDFVFAVDGTVDMGIHDFNNVIVLRVATIRQRSTGDVDGKAFVDISFPSVLALRAKGNIYVYGSGGPGGGAITASLDNQYHQKEGNDGADGDEETGGAGGLIGYQTIPSFMSGGVSGAGADGIGGAGAGGVAGGGGGGGGASVLAAGADGGSSSASTPGSGGVVSSGGAAVNGSPSVWLIANGKIRITGDVSSVGIAGNDGADHAGSGAYAAGAGGSGGGAGGNIILVAKDYVNIGTIAGLNTSGGDGGDGGDASGAANNYGGSGGGGGAAGSVYVRSATVTNNSTPTVTGGAGGALGTGSTANGAAGSAGGTGKITIMAYQPSSSGFKNPGNAESADPYLLPYGKIGFIGE
jgi:hypothetical protein